MLYIERWKKKKVQACGFMLRCVGDSEDVDCSIIANEKEDIQKINTVELYFNTVVALCSRAPSSSKQINSE